MGNGNQKQERVVPERGYRVVSLNKKNLQNFSLLNILTDYIISPDPKLVDLSRQSIRFEVYSILSQDIRTVELVVMNKQLGVNMRLDDINSCILRITKVFPGSPLQKYGIGVGQFIVGVLQGNYNDIKSFAQLVASVSAIAPKSNISLGICGEDGKTKIIVIPVSQLIAYQAKRKGLLGCELAQGWIHKWRPLKQKKQKLEQMQTKSQQTTPSPQIQIRKIRPVENSQQKQKHSDSSEQIDRKCDQLDGFYNNEGVMEIKFKGKLKDEQIIDASTICKCKPLNRMCQKCFIHKDQHYYFFNVKNNQIVAISTKMMLPVAE